MGFLSLLSTPTKDEWDRTTFAIKLKELGWVEGRNIRIERAFAERKYERLSALAADLVGKKVDVIYAQGPDPALAAAHATKTIPIVFVGPTFPVEMGLVDSYARPGRNATGVAWSAGIEVYVKLLEFVRELAPATNRIAYFLTQSPLGELAFRTEFARQFVSAAKKTHLELRPFPVTRPEDFAPVFKAIKAWHAQALIVSSTPITSPESRRIAEFASTNRIPNFSDSRIFTEAGGLCSYGPEISHLAVQGAGQIDKILRGTKPADLPVEMPTLYELVVNRKTATSLGVKIPQSVLLRVDRVIE